MIGTLLSDLILATRRAIRARGISATIVLSVAIAAAANTTLLGWIQAVISNPLPAVPSSDRLVAFASRTQAGELTPVSHEDYLNYRDGLRSLEGLAAFQGRELGMETSGSGEVEQAWGMFVTGNFFDVLDLVPVRGTFFQPEQAVDSPGGQAVAVISYDYWERRFNRDPGVIGDTIVLNKQTYTIIGVAPPGFDGPITGLSYDVYLPVLQQDRFTGGDGGWIKNRKFRILLAVGRLAEGATIERAQAEANVLAASLAEAYPNDNLGMRAAVLPFNEAPYGAQSLLSGTLTLLLFASFAVILVVAANVSNLLLLSFSARDKEMGVRIALGAQPGRIAQLCMSEALPLGLAAAVLSLVLTYKGLDLIKLFLPALQLPVSLDPQFSPRLALYGVGISLLVVAAATFVPVTRAVGVKLGVILRDGTRAVGAGKLQRRFRQGLVTVQVAVAFVTLVSAILLVKTFVELSRVDPGFDPEHIMLVSLRPADPSMGLADIDVLAARAREDLRSSGLAGGVAYADYVPLGLAGPSWEDLRVEGYAPPPDESMKILRSLVSDDYFEVMRIPVVEGRVFSEQDTREAPKVAVVNETFARRYFAGRNAIGRRLVGWGQVLTIVGVVADSKYQSLTEAPRPYFYVPHRQFSLKGTELIMHVATTGGPVSSRFEEAVGRELTNSVRAAAHVSWSMPLERYIAATVFRNRLAMTLLSCLAAVTLVLSAMGMYGVLSNFVLQRTAEIGIRMSLGASKADVVRLILLQGVRPVLVGVGVGVVLTLAISQVLTTFLYGVAPIDVGVYAGVGALLLGVAALVCVGPAYRAGMLEPSIAARTT